VRVASQEYEGTKGLGEKHLSTQLAEKLRTLTQRPGDRPGRRRELPAGGKPSVREPGTA